MASWWCQGWSMPIRIRTSGARGARSAVPAPSCAARVVELNAKLAAPALVDPQRHLDKSRTRRAVANPSAPLEGASAGYRAFAAAVTHEDIVARAENTLDICLAHGTVAIRSHTNT